MRIALDDFGAGYTSLRQLQSFPVDVVKLDQSFINTTMEHDVGVLDGLISMANSLGLETVGEGIEETAQLSRLREAHCRYAQGYLFSRPVPVDELDAALTQAGNAAASLTPRSRSRVSRSRRGVSGLATRIRSRTSSSGANVRQQVEQVAVVGHVAHVGVRPVGAPQHAVGRGGDERPGERHDVVVGRRAVGGQSLGAGDLHPARSSRISSSSAWNGSWSSPSHAARGPCGRSRTGTASRSSRSA